MIKKKIDQITEVRKIEGKWNLDSICQFHLISTSTIILKSRNRSTRTEGSRLIFVRTSASHLRLHLEMNERTNEDDEQKYCSLPTIFSLVNWI